MGAPRILTFGGNQPLVDALVAAAARFLVIGGAAMRFHVPSRPLGGNDLDLWLEATEENAARVGAALHQLGIRISAAALSELTQPRRKQIKLGREYAADLLTVPALPFDDHAAAAFEAELFGHRVLVAARRDGEGAGAQRLAGLRG